MDELAALATEVVAARTAAAATSKGDDATPLRKRKRRRRNMSAEDTPSSAPLAGLRVYVMHCKEDLEQEYSRPIYHVIRDQVEALVQAKGLGAEVLSVEQGMTISMFVAIS